MNVKSMAISSFANFIVGENVFSRLKGVVERQDGTELTGEQKKQAVLKEIETIGLDVAGWLLNLAIELAVAWLRTKAK